MTGELPEALELLRAGSAAWEQLGRPLDAARCELLLGERLRRARPGRGRRGAREGRGGVRATRRQAPRRAGPRADGRLSP